MPILDSPTLAVIPSYVAALREGYRVGIQKPKTETDIAVIEQDPQAFLADKLAVKTDPVTFPDGSVVPRVPHTAFWYVDDSVFIGEINVRHHLNEKLMISGRHIGYGVRPSAQGQGHATAMLRLALDFCRDTLGLERVLMTVDDTNTPSIKVIEKNGGILENKVPSLFSGALSRRYWIIL